MIKNYILVALRNLKRHKGYSLINITGFAVGIACCILLALYIKSELSFDRYHRNADRIFRLCIRGNTGGAQFEWGESNAVAAQVLRDDYPEVIDAVRFGDVQSSSVKHKDKLFFEGNLRYADDSVFNIFSWSLLRGDPKTALKVPYSIVLTEDMAEKYFGPEDPMEKILTFNGQKGFTVTGVMQNVPQNSTMSFDALCSFQTLYVQDEKVSPILRNWLDINFETYLLLQENFNYKELDKKLPALLEKYAGYLMKIWGSRQELFLQSLTDIHLRRPGDGAVLYVYVFSIIALFVLLIACVNFMNISTARSAKRAQEVGMRKVFGAARKRLVMQFLSESMMYCVLSFLIALVLVEIFIPLIKSLIGYPIDLQIKELAVLLPGFIILVFLTGVVAGSYPAFFLSSFQPVSVLKGSLKRGASSSRLRSVLVVVQFTVSISLIIGTGLIQNQLLYLKNKDLGFDKENVIIVSLLDDTVRKSVDVIKEELRADPRIINIATSSTLPGWDIPFNSKLPEGYAINEMQLMSEINVDADFIPVMGIELASGRNFSKEFPSDEQQSVIINETAANQFGWKEPLGKIIRTTGSTKKVIGVVKDFHLESLSQTIRPLFMANESDHRFVPLRFLLIKTKSGEISESLQFIEHKWKTIFPGVALNSFFLDETIAQQLRRMEKSREIFSYFTFLAIFIACLGLFGMSAYTTEQRTKEIGIRKVLGSSSSGIILFLSKELLKHIVVATVVSWPIAFYFLNRWLEDFPYRTNISLSTFVLSSLIVLLIGMTTISYQALKAALANPVDSLRYE